MPVCCHEQHEEEVNELKSAVDVLRTEVSQLKELIRELHEEANTRVSNLQSSNATNQGDTRGQTQQWSTVEQRKDRKASTAPRSASNNKQESGKKGNIILYGVPECHSGTSRSARLELDLSNAVSVLSTLESSCQSQSICDCYRLGKYSPHGTRPRPLLVKFVRAIDASNILSKKGKLTRPYLIKPDMTQEQRKIESVLLKERWNLMQSGVSRTAIKIQGSNLYVTKKPHGRVVNSRFEPTSASPVNTTAESVTPQTVASQNTRAKSPDRNSSSVQVNSLPEAIVSPSPSGESPESAIIDSLSISTTPTCTPLSMPLSFATVAATSVSNNIPPTKQSSKLPTIATDLGREDTTQMSSRNTSALSARESANIPIAPAPTRAQTPTPKD